MLGLACAIAIGSLLIDLLPTLDHAVPQVQPIAERSVEAIGLAVVVDQGIALVGVGLLLLASLIGAGFLARRGVD
jgi:NADH:ubiquinone oxidoreductase subunit 6 (subunit J)